MTTTPHAYKYSGWHFAFFRIVFGLYLAIHFWDLTTYAPELWSAAGNLSDPRILPSYGIFPNILFWFTDPSFAQGFVWTLFAASLMFMAGFLRPIAALLLWYGWACLAGRNPFITNPGIPFIGLLLLICVIIPNGEPLSLTKPKNGQDWHMPEGVFAGVWIIMVLGYTLSGLHKCLSSSWVDGTAIIHLLNNPLSRDNGLRELLLSMPEFLLRLNTWGVLGLEILFGPLCLFAFTRKWTWLAMIGMHLGIVSLVNFTDLTFGILMVHLFTFDERWLPAKKTDSHPVLFFDGVCGLCNRFIQFLFDVDTDAVFKVATLQGDVARQKLPELHTKELNSLVVMTHSGETLTKSKAVLYVMNQVGGLWRVVYFVGSCVPSAIADGIYSAVATRRYSWFGKSESCRMPTPAERSRFVG